jgi:DNA helicase-2/ATP-dependent DNA helicase PcrA
MLHGQVRYGIASRFLHEIPESLVRRVNTRFRSKDSGFRSRNAGFAIQDSGFSGQDSGSRGKSAAPAAPFTQHSALSTQHSIPWRIGQSVVHPKFGAGVIVGAEGRGPEARVQVNFRDGGLKWLMLDYAKLAAA